MEQKIREDVAVFSYVNCEVTGERIRNALIGRLDKTSGKTGNNREDRARFPDYSNFGESSIWFEDTRNAQLPIQPYKNPE
jgi:hypothetical protein